MHRTPARRVWTRQLWRTAVVLAALLGGLSEWVAMWRGRRQQIWHRPT